MISVNFLQASTDDVYVRASMPRLSHYGQNSGLSLECLVYIGLVSVIHSRPGMTSRLRPRL